MHYINEQIQIQVPNKILTNSFPVFPCQCEIRNLSRPMVVTRPISSLVTKLEPSAGQKTSRISPESAGEYQLIISLYQFNQFTSFNLCQPLAAGFVLHDGLLMGIVFAAFLVGVSLMGGLWCIYTMTGKWMKGCQNGVSPTAALWGAACKVTQSKINSDNWVI